MHQLRNHLIHRQSFFPEHLSGFHFCLSQFLQQRFLLGHQGSLMLIEQGGLAVSEGTQIHIKLFEQSLILIHHILIRFLQFRLHCNLSLALIFYDGFLLYSLQDIFYMNFLIILAFGGGCLQFIIEHSQFTREFITLLSIFFLFLTYQAINPITLRFTFLNIKTILWQEFLCHTLCIIEFLTPLTNPSPIIQQGAIRIYHLISHSANQHLAILLLLRPEAHILILLFKLLNLFTIKVEVNAVILITHRADDGILDEIGIQLGIEEDILDGAGDILVLCTLHNGILAERKEFLTSIVSKDDVTIHLITAYERRYIMFLTHLLTYLSPLAIHLFMLIDKPFAIKRGIDETEHHSSLILQGKNTISPILTHHLINDV